MAKFLTLKELANKMGLNRSHARRWIISQGFSFHKVRDPESRQLVNALLKADAKTVLEVRKSQGFGNPKIVVEDNTGFFYLVQLVPELDQSRIKMGFAANVEKRLGSHRTSAPTAKLLGKWPCHRRWENAVIDSITRGNSKSLSNEVFQVNDTDELVSRCHQFFELMP